MKILAIIILAASLLFSGCVGVEGPEGPPGQNADLDKEIRFELAAGPLVITGGDTLVLANQALLKFNKSSYALIDSATIGVYAKATGAGENSFAYAELYDMNSGAAIDSSVLEFSSPEYEFLESKNFYKFLSSPGRDLALRIRTGSGVELEFVKAYLFLYRSGF